MISFFLISLTLSAIMIQDYDYQNLTRDGPKNPDNTKYLRGFVHKVWHTIPQASEYHTRKVVHELRKFHSTFVILCLSSQYVSQN